MCQWKKLLLTSTVLYIAWNITVCVYGPPKMEYMLEATANCQEIVVVDKVWMQVNH